MCATCPHGSWTICSAGLRTKPSTGHPGPHLSQIKAKLSRIKSRGIKHAAERCGRTPQNWLPENAGADGCAHQGRVRPQQNHFTLKPEHSVQQPSPLTTPGLSRIRSNTPSHDKNGLRAHGYTHIPTTRRTQGCSGALRKCRQAPQGAGGLSVSWSGCHPSGRTHRYLHWAFLDGQVCLKDADRISGNLFRVLDASVLNFGQEFRLQLRV